MENIFEDKIEEVPIIENNLPKNSIKIWWISKINELNEN